MINKSINIDGAMEVFVMPHDFYGAHSARTFEIPNGIQIFYSLENNVEKMLLKFETSRNAAEKIKEKNDLKKQSLFIRNEKYLYKFWKIKNIKKSDINENNSEMIIELETDDKKPSHMRFGEIVDIKK